MGNQRPSLLPFFSLPHPCPCRDLQSQDVSGQFIYKALYFPLTLFDCSFIRSDFSRMLMHPGFAGVPLRALTHTFLRARRILKSFLTCVCGLLELNTLAENARTQRTASFCTKHPWAGAKGLGQPRCLHRHCHMNIWTCCTPSHSEHKHLGSDRTGSICALAGLGWW